ncbi:MAG: helix-turn-helix domain-containing protein [Rhizobiaceae bacterium]
MLPAAIAMPHQEFAKFQADSLNQMSKRLNFDALTVNLVRLNQHGIPDGDIVSAVAYTPISTISNYQRHLHLDEFTPFTFMQPGSAVFVDAVKPMDYWENSTGYRVHCTPYDFHWVLGISYAFPFHASAVVAIDYMRAKSRNFPNDLEEFEVEYLSFPYYLGWLLQFGAIDQHILRFWLALLADMPPSRFRVVRGFAERKAVNAKTLARSMGCSKKTIYRHLEHAFDELLLRDNRLTDLIGSPNRILALSQAYRFFEFGSAAVERVLPVRRSGGG